MSTAATEDFPSLSGGIPLKSQDLAPSIIFTLAFAVLLVPAVYRLCKKSSRSLMLVRPTVFCVAQALAYALRAVIANGSSSPDVYKASEILLLSGLILLCEPIPALLTRVVGKQGDGFNASVRMNLVRRILALLRVALVISLIMGILAATSITDAPSDARTQKIKDYRTANAALILGGIGGTAILGVYTFFHGLLPARAAAFLVLAGSLIVLTAAYKLENTLKPVDNYSKGGKVVFYFLNSACQWCATALYFSVNLNELFVDPKDEVPDYKDPGKFRMNPPLRGSPRCAV